MPLRTNHHASRFHCDVEHLGFEAEFYHPNGARLGLDDSVEDAYTFEKETAEIFIQLSSSTPFSSEELLNWFLLQTGTQLDDHLPPAAKSRGTGSVLVTFPIRFHPATFAMMTEDGRQDLSRLNLMTRIRFRPVAH